MVMPRSLCSFSSFGLARHPDQYKGTLYAETLAFRLLWTEASSDQDVLDCLAGKTRLKAD